MLSRRYVFVHCICPRCFRVDLFLLQLSRINLSLVLFHTLLKQCLGSWYSEIFPHAISLIQIALCFGLAAASTMDDLWNGKAHFEFVSKAQFPTVPGGEYGMNVGFQFVTRLVNNVETWFLFHREYAFATPPSYCQYDYARIVVRNSTDQGRTWSNKVSSSSSSSTSTSISTTTSFSSSSYFSFIEHLIPDCHCRPHSEHGPGVRHCRRRRLL
jgi:hypothetical protein